MKITNENFFELNGKKPDDEANENKSEDKRTAAERLRNELMSLFELDDRPDDEVDENASEAKQTAADEANENRSDAKQTSADEVYENASEAKQTAADEANENMSDAKQTSADEVDENASEAKQTAADEANENRSDAKQTAANEVDENKSEAKQTVTDEVNENKSATKRTAAERLREKLMSLREHDDGEIYHNASTLDVPVNNNKDTSEGETKAPDDAGNVVDSQKAAPIVSPHDEKQIDTAPSKDDVHQPPADNITARHVAFPEKSKEDYQDKDELSTNDGDAHNVGDTLSKLPTTNDGDEPNENDDTSPKLPTTNDCDEPNANDDTLSKLPTTNDGDEPNANDDDILPTTNDGDEPNVNDTLPKLSITNDVDESNAKDADKRIQLKRPDDKNPEKFRSHKKTLALVGGVAFALIAPMTIVGINHMCSTTSQSSRTVAQAKKMDTSSSSNHVDGSSLNAVKKKLTATAKATSQPYMVQVTALGGGYTMGVITYYPNDATKTYMDYSITAPKTPGAVTDDKKAQDINKKLSSSLPTINKTITVIDSSKVSMNTYKQSDGSYHTILLYDNKPFGFVTTKADGSMVNNVTTYYIQNVQKKNK